MLGQVPVHESLFCNPQDRGLPVGNLTSQFLSKVYLNELDQFKQSLKSGTDLAILEESGPGKYVIYRQIRILYIFGGQHA